MLMLAQRIASPLRQLAGGALLCALSLCALPSQAETLRLLVAKSANESGLVSRLANAFEADNPGIQIRLIPAGSLHALEQGREGDGDAILSHVDESERLFVADGYGLSRTLVMYNNFALFGPPDDALGLRQQTNLLAALRTIAAAEPAFLIQGDRSGTQYRLAQLWAAARIRPAWPGYETTFGGSPSTLSTAAEFGAYTFADLGSYFSLPPERRAQIVPLIRDHRALRNNYHYIVINPDLVPGVRRDLAEAFRRFLISDKAQQIIGHFGGEQPPITLFTPAAHLDQGVIMARNSAQVASQQRNLYLLGAAVIVALALSLFGLFIYRRARTLAGQALRHAGRIERAVAGSQEGMFEWDMVAGSLYTTPPLLQLLDVTQTEAHNLHALLRQALDNTEANRVSIALQHAIANSQDNHVRIELSCQGKRLELRGLVEQDRSDNPVRLTGTVREQLDSPMLEIVSQAENLRDQLTGLPTRQLLTDRLQHAIQQCARSHQTCMVLMVGLNAVRGTGTISDTLPDDDMIKAVAARLRQLLRASDTIARIDERNLAILLPASDEPHCRLAMEKLLAGLQRPFHIKNQSLLVDGAIGCAMYPDHGKQHQSLLQRAQLAMLQATRDGEPIVIYQPPMVDEDIDSPSTR